MKSLSWSDRTKSAALMGAVMALVSVGLYAWGRHVNLVQGFLIFASAPYILPLDHFYSNPPEWLINFLSLIPYPVYGALVGYWLHTSMDGGWQRLLGWMIGCLIVVMVIPFLLCLCFLVLAWGAS
jgi:hypothetical protein